MSQMSYYFVVDVSDKLTDKIMQFISILWLGYLVLSTL